MLFIQSTSPTHISRRKKMSKLESAGGGVQARPKSRHEFGSRMSVLLSNPDYLLEGFAEKKCQFLGIIDDVPTNSDMSDRSYLLSTLDNKRNSKMLPWTLGKEHNVSLTISAYNMKIIKDDRGGAILHRIPLHEIASASYINDDGHHILFIKAGDASKPCCSCYTFMFSKRAEAEEACTILQQAFQLVYTEATMEHLNESISAGEKGSFMSRSSLMLTPRQRHFSTSPPRATTPTQTRDTPEGASPRQASPPPLVPTLIEEVGGPDGDNSSSAVELVQDYMERLHKLLDFNELREFATLLKLYREDLKVNDFLKKLQDLYGEQRKFLIPDMNSFIPEEDIEAFEKFLSDNNLVSTTLLPPGQPVDAVPTSPPTPPKATSDGDDDEDILTTNF